MRRLLFSMPLLMTLPACGVNNNLLPAAEPEYLQRVNAIRDGSLPPDQKRQELIDLGIDDPVVLNGILRGERLANQFAGTRESAFEKVVEELFTTMTPDEIQHYGDSAAEAGTAFTGTFNDVQAQAMADFFRSNSIDSPDELQAFLDDPAKEVPAAITVTDLRTLFVDVDPQDVRPAVF